MLKTSWAIARLRKDGESLDRRCKIKLSDNFGEVAENQRLAALKSKNKYVLVQVLSCFNGKTGRYEVVS